MYIANFSIFLERSIGFPRMLCGTVLYCVHCTLYSGSRVHTEYTHIFNMECCSVTSCKKSQNLHRFPNDVHIRRQWTVFCCRASSWIPGPGDRICQLHFSSQDIKSDGRLKEEAVPHIRGIFKS